MEKVSIQEVKAVIVELKNNKASGSDNVQAELLINMVESCWGGVWKSSYWWFGKLKTFSEELKSSIRGNFAGKNDSLFIWWKKCSKRSFIKAVRDSDV